MRSGLHTRALVLTKSGAYDAMRTTLEFASRPVMNAASATAACAKIEHHSLLSAWFFASAKAPPTFKKQREGTVLTSVSRRQLHWAHSRKGIVLSTPVWGSAPITSKPNKYGFFQTTVEDRSAPWHTGLHRELCMAGLQENVLDGQTCRLPQPPS